MQFFPFITRQYFKFTLASWWTPLSWRPWLPNALRTQLPWHSPWSLRSLPALPGRTRIAGVAAVALGPRHAWRTRHARKTGEATLTLLSGDARITYRAIRNKQMRKIWRFFEAIYQSVLLDQAFQQCLCILCRAFPEVPSAQPLAQTGDLYKYWHYKGNQF